MGEHRLFPTVPDRAMGAAMSSVAESMAATSLEFAGLGRRRTKLLSLASGVVVEVGAGPGANLGHYPDTITSLLLLESDPASRRKLEARVRSLGPSVPIEVRAAAVHDAGIEPGTVDTVVATLILCTIRDLGPALVTIRTWLADGGRLLFLEHVRAPGPRGAVQRFAAPLWSRLADGCHPDRDLTGAIRSAGMAITDCERFTMPHGNVLLSNAVQGMAIASPRAKKATR